MADMKARILDAAYSILSEEGPAAFTTRRVCEDVGVTMPTLYHHFSSRDELLQAVYVLALQKFMSRKASLVLTENPLSDLRSGSDLVLDFAARHRHVTAAVMGRGLQEPGLLRPSFELLQQRVRRAAESRMLRVSEREAAAMVWSVVQGLVVATVANPDTQGLRPEVRKRVLDALFAAL